MSQPRALRSLVCSLALLAAPAPAAAQEVSIDTFRQGDFIVIEASADLMVDIRVVWQVLTDYDHLADFIPDLRSSRVVSRGPDGIVIEQKGEYSFLFFSQPVELRLAIIESPPHHVSSRAIGGSFREMTGSYDLAPIPGGVKLRYAGRMVPGFDLPPFFGVVAARAGAEKQFRGMVNEILRRSAAATGGVAR